MVDQSLKSLLSRPTTRPLCVVSIGECMVEMAPSAEPSHFRQSFAGDAFNTLWYLQQLRPTWNARFVSRVGQDQISDDMVTLMAGAGVDTRHVQRSADRSVGLYLISLKDGERSFSYWRSQSAARQLADDPTLIEAAIEDADVVFFSGITIAILEAPARVALLQVLDAARQAGKTIAFDPNLRPRLWRDLSDMRGAIMDAATVSDIVLPSFEEEAAHFGDACPEATSGRYLAAGASTVVVKNGAEVVHYVHQDQSGLVIPEPVTELVDTTSAGDSFNAGLFAGMGRYSSMEDAIKMASRVARQVIGEKGALVRLNLDAVERP